MPPPSLHFLISDFNARVIHPETSPIVLEEKKFLENCFCKKNQLRQGQKKASDMFCCISDIFPGRVSLKAASLHMAAMQRNKRWVERW